MLLEIIPFKEFDKNQRNHFNSVTEGVGREQKLVKQSNLEVDGDDVQELLDLHNKELTIYELIEMCEQRTLKNLILYTQFNCKLGRTPQFD